VEPDERFVVRSAKADRILWLAADGEAGSIAGGVGLGATEVVVPWRPNDEPMGRGDLRVVLGGLTGETRWSQGRDELRLTRLGLGAGPSFAEARGTRFVQIDLNPRDMRAFDATITFGLPRIALAPRFDLGVMWRLAALAGDFREPPPSYLLDETYGVVFDPAAGAGPAFEPFDTGSSGAQTRPAPPPPGTPPPPPPPEPISGIRVVAGKLSVSSTRAPSPVVVEAGQCLWSGPAAPGAHPVLGGLRAGACPQ
jgi:hypothetical protein